MRVYLIFVLIAYVSLLGDASPLQNWARKLLARHQDVSQQSSTNNQVRATSDTDGKVDEADKRFTGMTDMYPDPSYYPPHHNTSYYTDPYPPYYNTTPYVPYGPYYDYPYPTNDPYYMPYGPYDYPYPPYPTTDPYYMPYGPYDYPYPTTDPYYMPYGPYDYPYPTTDPYYMPYGPYDYPYPPTDPYYLPSGSYYDYPYPTTDPYYVEPYLSYDPSFDTYPPPYAGYDTSYYPTDSWSSTPASGPSSPYFGYARRNVNVNQRSVRSAPGKKRYSELARRGTPKAHRGRDLFSRQHAISHQARRLGTNKRTFQGKRASGSHVPVQHQRRQLKQQRRQFRQRRNFARRVHP